MLKNILLNLNKLCKKSEQLGIKPVDNITQKIVGYKSKSNQWVKASSITQTLHINNSHKTHSQPTSIYTLELYDIHTLHRAYDYDYYLI